MAGRDRMASTLDLVEMAQRMFEAAAAVTTGQLRLTDPTEAHALLARGDAQVLTHFRHELAHQVGTALLWMDPHVIAVYEDQRHDALSLATPLQIIVQVDDETAALRSLVAGLGAALSQVTLEGIGTPSGMRLDPLIVDSRSARLLFGGSRGLQREPALLASRDSVVAHRSVG